MARNRHNIADKTGDTLFVTEELNSVLTADSNYFQNLTGLDSPMLFNGPDKVRQWSGAFLTAPPNGGIPKLWSEWFFLNKPYLYFEHIWQPEPGPGPGEPNIFHLRLKKNTGFQGPVGLTPHLTILRNHLAALDNFKFYDHATSVNIYEEGSNRQEESHGLLNMYAEIKSEYNFHQKKYERVITEEPIEEVALPNIYNFLLGDQQGPAAPAILSQGERIRLDPQLRCDVGDIKPVNNYYEQWSENWKEWSEDDNYVLNEKMRTVYFTKKETEQLTDLYQYRESFPMFNTVEFTTEPYASLGTILEDTNFSTQMMNLVKEPGAMLKIIKTNQYRIKYAPPTSAAARVGAAQGFVATSKASASVQNVKYYNVDQFFKEYEYGNHPDTIYFNRGVVQQDTSAFYNLMAMIVEGRVNKLKKEKSRSYQDLLSGTLAYSEPVFYIIEKSLGQNAVVQTFYFTNTEKLDVLKFVDTQVKYDTRYTYRIKSLNLIIGTEYSYHNPVLVEDDETLNVTVKVNPSIKLMETVLFQKSVQILDSPPVAPNVTFVPLKGVSDKIKILLNMGVDKYMVKPIIFSQQEEQMISEMKIAQDISEEQEEITFATDDTVEEFLIYRMDTEPRSYADFESFAEKQYIKTGNTRINATRQEKQRTSSAAMQDKIRPNTTYYYCVRAVDVHGHISYPSSPYKIEMVEDAGSIYPLIEIYDFKKPVVSQPTRGVKRFVSISPASVNLFVDEEAMSMDPDVGPALGDEVKLGISSSPAWDKRFKMRLTSKTTGRKIDVNFKFDYRQEDYEPDES